MYGIFESGLMVGSFLALPKLFFGDFLPLFCAMSVLLVLPTL